MLFQLRTEWVARPFSSNAATARRPIPPRAARLCGTSLAALILQHASGSTRQGARPREHAPGSKAQLAQPALHSRDESLLMIASRSCARRSPSRRCCARCFHPLGAVFLSPCPRKRQAIGNATAALSHPVGTRSPSESWAMHFFPNPCLRLLETRPTRDRESGRLNLVAR